VKSKHFNAVYSTARYFKLFFFKIIFFYFLKFIFNINTLKQSKKINFKKIKYLIFFFFEKTQQRNRNRQPLKPSSVPQLFISQWKVCFQLNVIISRHSSRYLGFTHYRLLFDTVFHATHHCFEHVKLRKYLLPSAIFNPHALPV